MKQVIELPASNKGLCNSFIFLKSEYFVIVQKLLTLFLEDGVFYQMGYLLYMQKLVLPAILMAICLMGDLLYFVQRGICNELKEERPFSCLT